MQMCTYVHSLAYIPRFKQWESVYSFCWNTYQADNTYVVLTRGETMLQYIDILQYLLLQYMELLDVASVNSIKSVNCNRTVSFEMSLHAGIIAFIYVGKCI